MDRKQRVAVLMALLGAAPVAAQAQALDPAAIQVPDLAFVPTSADRDSFHKYFFYWKAGVSFERASADLTECYDHIAGGEGYFPFAMVLDETPATSIHKPAPKRAVQNNYGLAGAVITSLMAAPQNFRAGRQRFRMCMGFKNYTRYGASKPLWERITDGEPMRAIAVQAKIASGPAPSGEPIDP